DQNAGKKYAIVARSGGSAIRYALWRATIINHYPRGSSGRSTNGGATWTLYGTPPTDYDSMFEEWGFPKE
ncbi:unnamed protein product, partial [marine sediment metagenome]